MATHGLKDYIIINMTTITQKEFDKLCHSEAKRVHNKFLRMGQFWPIQVCKNEARKKLLTQYKISK